MVKLHLINKKNGILILFLLISCTLKAQVMWNLKGGMMPRKSYTNEYFSGSDEKKTKCIDWMTGLEIEIPLSKKLNIETGLRFDHHTSAIEDDWGTDRNNTNHLTLPLRLAYKVPMGKNFTLRAGAGPYASYTLGGNVGEEWYSNLRAGVETCVAVDWKCLSLGATYDWNCLYKGFHDMNKPSIMLTLGIRFRSHVWRYVGAGLLTLCTVGAAYSTLINAIDYAPNYDSGSSFGGYGSSIPSESSSPSSTGRTCRSCGGSGVCTLCKGQGGYWVDSGTFTGTGNKKWATCGSCAGGNGKCRVCHGKGSL